MGMTEQKDILQSILMREIKEFMGRTAEKNRIRLQGGNNEGFTLVELVVVLVIIALLAAILVPAMLGYIDQARKEKEAANAKALMNAVQVKMNSLYDQGIMPNVDHTNAGDQSVAGGFSWKTEWSKEVLYRAGTDEKPYICGFMCGDLCSKHADSCLNHGLKELKKGYRVYLFFYMQSEESEPIFYYNDEWTYIPPDLKNYESKDEDPPGKYSAWYVPNGCEGIHGNAGVTFDIAYNAASQ